MTPGAKVKQLVEQLPPRQRTLDFTRSDQWQQLPPAAQQACCLEIAKLLCQTITARKENEHER